jgi:hypothetical protein
MVGHFYIKEILCLCKTSVLKTLQSGKQFTAGQMAGLFRSTEGSVAARITELRAQGYSIYSNTAKNGKTAYRLGTSITRV